MISLKLAAFPQRNLPRSGTCGVGDPACDLAIAWTLLTAEGRQAFRQRLPVGETAWARGPGWALWKTLATCAYTLGQRRPGGRERATHTRPAAPSRRTLALPRRCIDALRTVAERRASECAADGSRWHDSGLVFTTKFGTALDAADVRRDFRTAMRGAEGINPKDWTRRELRHSFVPLLSDNGLPIDEIARLVGHSSSAVTELVYRQQIRPVVQSGAVIMDRIFDVNEDS